MKRKKDFQKKLFSIAEKICPELQELLQEAVNQNLLEAARVGFSEIDRRADRAKKCLRSWGILADSIVDNYAGIVKKKAAELATGRSQE